MAKLTVVIATRRGPQPMDAIWEQAGLAVHRDYWEPGEHCLGEDWTVSHVRSGFAVRTGLEQEEALALAEALLPCGDWTQDYAALVADDALYAAVRKAARGMQWNLPSKRVMDRRREHALAEYSA